MVYNPIEDQDQREFRWPTAYLNNIGRNGGMRSCGLYAWRSVLGTTDELVLQPISSSGKISDAIRIVIPFSALPEVAQLLTWFAAGPLGRLAIENQNPQQLG